MLLNQKVKGGVGLWVMGYGLYGLWAIDLCAQVASCSL